MVDFTLHDTRSAPAAARPALEKVEKSMGFVPNLFGKMAEAPAALDGYLALSEIYGRSSLNAQDQQVALLAISVENGCEFCVAAHSAGAKSAGVGPEIVAALRRGETPAHTPLGALAAFARTVVRKRGFVDEESLQRFIDAGYTRQNVLEVVLATALKTLSNYTNHIAQTPLNRELESERWQASARKTAS